MKKISCTAFILLTFSFAFANAKNIVHKNFSNTSSTTYTQNAVVNTNVVLSISYDVPSFCANAKGISTPTVSEAGGVFKAIRISTGNGGLAINQATGKIDQFISDAGSYDIIYTIGTKSTKTTLTVSTCK